MIYLASPYTGTPAEQDFRYSQAKAFTQLYLAKGHHIYSPICYGHQFAAALGNNFKSWAAFSEHMLGLASELWVLQLPGWDTSVGVKQEIQLYQFLYPEQIRFIPQ